MRSIIDRSWLDVNNMAFGDSLVVKNLSIGLSHSDVLFCTSCALNFVALFSCGNIARSCRWWWWWRRSCDSSGSSSNCGWWSTSRRSWLGWWRSHSSCFSFNSLVWRSRNCLSVCWSLVRICWSDSCCFLGGWLSGYWLRCLCRVGRNLSLGWGSTFCLSWLLFLCYSVLGSCSPVCIINIEFKTYSEATCAVVVAFSEAAGWAGAAGA